MKYTYLTRGTCSKKIEFDINDDIITNIKFFGGCPGNLRALELALNGKTVDEIEKMFKGIRCGDKPTSCSDQLAIAVRRAYDEINERR